MILVGYGHKLTDEEKKQEEVYEYDIDNLNDKQNVMIY